MSNFNGRFGFRRGPRPQGFFLLLYVLCALCGSTEAQDFKTVHDGVEYAEVTREVSGLPVRMNLLRLDLTRVRLDVVHAIDSAIGTEKTSSIATRHGAVAAINAGFFRLDKSEFAGDPAGILMIDGSLLSESTNARCALMIANLKNSTAVRIGHFETSSGVWLRNGGAYQHISISGIDRERKKDEAVLFDPWFGASTHVSEPGIEIAIGKCKPTRPHDFPDIECKQVQFYEGSADLKIPRGGFVLSIGREYVSESRGSFKEIEEFFKARKQKRHAKITLSIGEGHRGIDTDRTVDITNGVPQLIKDGKLDITWQQEKTTKSFVETRHPRTAVAKLKDGKFLMITVDGRSESSGGIGLYDLANYLLQLGAADAMNLDGGGSTTMFLDGKVVNHPSDKEGERKISDAILVTLRNPRQDRPHQRLGTSSSKLLNWRF